MYVFDFDCVDQVSLGVYFFFVENLEVVGIDIFVFDDLVVYVFFVVGNVMLQDQLIGGFVQLIVIQGLLYCIVVVVVEYLFL